ncbi:hypothetical protein M3B74_02880 [Citrobacter freundii]|uniref:hypothetical protein n=1 Tax=Citrobacter freundii TaxID=546 RepID=UPI001EEFC738|nr:hypothetical protein [Citrobacter freundii]MCT1465829.1 hypothetical protein [Citrobacter freundii]MCT1493976.1 hypothetical protein [Citrobacter freundii]
MSEPKWLTEGGDSAGPSYVVKYHDTGSGEIKELRTGSGGEPVIEWPVTEPSLDAAKEATTGMQGGSEKKNALLLTPRQPRRIWFL